MSDDASAKGFDCLGQGFRIGHRAAALVRLASGADGGVEVGPSQRLFFRFVEVTDGAEAVGVAVARLSLDDRLDDRRG